VTLPADATYFKQPDRLLPPPPIQQATKEFIYLSVREQEIGAVEVPSLRDVALGGPDTTQRIKILQQIIRQNTNVTDCTTALEQQKTVWNSLGQSFNPKTMRLESLASLKVQPDNSGPPPSPCDPIAQGGYLGAENQLIRVRISAASKFVWGFDNASFLYRVSWQDKNTLVLDGPPVDAFHFPRAGQAVEVLQTQTQLPDGGLIAADIGTVFTLQEAYKPDTKTIKLPDPGFTPSPGNLQLFVRIWEAEVPFTSNTPITLGSTGLQVTLQSSTNSFHPGDFWAFAARPSTPAKVYPTRYLGALQPPDGPREWVCPLAVIQWTDSATGNVLADCREQFDNLVALTRRKTGASCCTVIVNSDDLNGTTTLQSIVDKLKSTPSKVCLQPGKPYLLPEPLRIGPDRAPITIEGCHPGVVLRSKFPENKAFLDGLVILDQAKDIILRGLRFELSLVPFVGSGGLLADIALQSLVDIGGPDIGSLQTAIGIRVLKCANLRIEDCIFAFPNTDPFPVFEAGVFANGSCQGLTLRDNLFSNETSQSSPGDAEVRIGLLMAPAISNVMLRRDTTKKATLVSGLVTPSSLDNTAICGNAFLRLSAAALIYAETGNLRIDSNRVTECYSGFNLFELRFQRKGPGLGGLSTAVRMDFPFALGGSIAQGFPLPASFGQVDQQSVSGPLTTTQLPQDLDAVLARGIRLDDVFAAAVYPNAPFPGNLVTSVIAIGNEVNLKASCGNAFVFWGDSVNNSARLVLSSNSMRGELFGHTSDVLDVPLTAVLMPAGRAMVTGNSFSDEGGNSVGLRVSPLEADGPAAITGNTILPGATIPVRWQDKNLLT
jgi:hypothetical protein